MTTGPLEPPDGQEDEPPDVRQALLVVLLLLGDVRAHLRGQGDADPADLLLRLAAVAAVLRRIRDRLGALP